ncbi:2',3'-cyclic-nucleotide 2'-phosphodiesterase (5'-nucleotidase family) [Scopulibacillus daqui]|uniref:2',3'-cyclic-nucleotide 2'-phosphodiesterase (5'-nucleotidase family) n=1 Tax=Scopulibacillus daqui TaxID=1469162 RepID=A0ABS2Q1C5_9BACL|nr:bifunctional UDP-sugar hydrolase/5'-nucleotidase [Scopulibacillus daqui]MBM7646098.1 2',3'-cyclic-nucleotide 2'-phosphodiesterase (5'-nucleotidase family) [Scopulibacillus daqui]
MIKLHLYHTNDIHSHFEHWPQIIHYFKKQIEMNLEKGEPYLLFDLGDHMDRVHPLTEGTMGKGNVFLLNQAGFDFVTIGNNEGITFTMEDINKAYDVRQFEIILANLFTSEGERPKWCKPYIFHKVNNITIGITGITAPFKPFYEPLGWDIKDPQDVLPEIIEKVKKKADIVILLSHAGLKFDQDTAKSIEGIHVILGSHTHHLLEDGLNVNSTLICQTGKFGHYAGHVILTYDETSKEIIDKKAMAVPMDETELRDSEAADLLEKLTKKGLKELQTPVTYLDQPLTTSWFNESPLSKLLADALRQWCQADFGMINAGAILDHLEPGLITKADLHRICPHPINPCKVFLTGYEIIEIIQKGLDPAFQTFELKGFGFRGKTIGKLIFSQLTYEINKIGETSKVVNVQMNGEPLELDRTYQVATIDMFTFGRLLPPIKEAPHKKFYLPEMLRDLLAWKLKNNHRP